MSRRGDIITSRFFPKVRPGWLAPPALRLALRYICMKTHSLCSLPTWWHPCLRIELRGPAAKVSWVIFCSGRLFGCLEIQNGHKQLGMERMTTSSLVPFQPFQPGRNKLRHALIGHNLLDRYSDITSQLNRLANETHANTKSRPHILVRSII